MSPDVFAQVITCFLLHQRRPVALLLRINKPTDERATEREHVACNHAAKAGIRRKHLPGKP